MEQATVALRELPKAASAAERAAEKWSNTTKEAGRSSEEFSRKVRKTIADLEFERQQLARSATERARFAVLRRAGVAEASAEGQAILASVKALEAQRAALGHVAIGTRAAGAAAASMTTVFRSMLATIGPVVLVFAALQRVMNAFDVASNLGEAAEQIGVTTRNLQALQFAATQSNVKVEQLDTGLSKFSQKMGEAAEGSKEMIDALTLLGVKNLDAAGKLRPTEDLLVDVAKAITNMDDPARKAAAAVDFFGKAGTRMLPMLAEIATGMDAVAQKADDAGAIIDDKTSASLDRLGDAMARVSQIITANLAVGLAKLLAIVEGVALGMTRLADAAGTGITKLVDAIEVGGAQAVAVFIEMFKAMPDALGQLFTNAWEAARVASAKGINLLSAEIADSKVGRFLGIGRTSLDENPSGTGPVGSGFAARAAAAGEAAAQAIRDRQQLARQAAMEQDEERARGGPKLGVVGGPTTVGASTSATKDAGKSAEDAEKKYAKLITTLTQTAAAQDQMTAAAGRGEKSFEAMKVHLEAQQKAFEIYGKVLDDTDPKLKKIEALLLRISQGKAAESFASATNELKNQNEILEKQIELMGQAPEIIAKEIALIKVRQEAEKGGTAITQEAIEARRQAIEQNETLKNQAEELKRAQELWTAPLKSALESIQQTAADAFESMLENGKFSFEELGNVFKKTITRMIAEFLALATIRPVMSVLVNAISPNMAQQMGLGSGNQAGGGILGNLLGGTGVGNFLGGTISGNLPRGQYGPPAPGQGFSSGFLGDVTWGQGLGALAGAGMGVYQLLSGGGSTASTIGGIASLVGAGVSLIPGIGQIAGPIIGLLGGLLPGLFGGTPEPPTNRAITSLNFSGGTFNQSGGSYGMDAPELSGLGASMKSLLDAAKVKITSSGFGLQQQTFSKGDFSNATTFITRPDGSQMQWGQSSDPAQQQKALDTAAANVAHSIMLEIGSGISDIMREGLSNFGLQNLQHAFSMEELGAAVAKLNQLDEAMKNFGKTTTDAEAAIKAVDEGFNVLFNTAAEFKISAGEVKKIEDERARQRLEATKEFSDGIDQALTEMKNPLQAALDANEKARTKDLVNNDEFLRLVEGYGDKRLQIEELYAMRRNKIIEQYNEEALAKFIGLTIGGVKTIQDLINSLSPGGALSGLDPRSQLAGLRASADASMAQAMADPSNTSLIDRAVADQRAFIEFNKSFTGGSVDYQSDVQRRIGALQNLQSGVVTAAMNRVSDTVTHSLLSQLLVAVTTDRALVNAVLARLDRYLANPDAADAA